MFEEYKKSLISLSLYVPVKAQHNLLMYHFVHPTFPPSVQYIGNCVRHLISYQVRESHMVCLIWQLDRTMSVASSHG